MEFGTVVRRLASLPLKEPIGETSLGSCAGEALALRPKAFFGHAFSYRTNHGLATRTNCRQLP